MSDQHNRPYHPFTTRTEDANQSVCVICSKEEEHHHVPMSPLTDTRTVHDVPRMKKVPICAWCETEFPGTHLPGSRMLKLHRCEPMMRHMADAAVARREQLGVMIDPKYRLLGVGNYHDNPVKYYIKEETARRIDDGESDPEEHRRKWFDRKLD